MDYSGHIPRKLSSISNRLVPKASYPKSPTDEEITSPIRRLTDNMLADNERVRKDILHKLIEEPGIIATFDNDFIVEFAPVEIRSLESPLDRNLNEYSIEVSQRWRIRRRTEEDGPIPLGGDSRGEARTD